MKTDSIFFSLFQTLPGAFFEIIGRPAAVAAGYRFSSVEVKQPTFRLDGVFIPPGDAPQEPIYFVEVQFQARRDFYWLLFARIFLYLEQEKPRSNWEAVALFASRNLDPGLPIQYGALREKHLRIVYLDELEQQETLSPGVGMVQLIVAPEEQVAERAIELLERLREPRENPALNQKMIELLETILVQKFPLMSQKEIAEMFTLADIKDTRVYKEALEEGKLEAVPLLIRSGLTVEQIAQELRLEVEAVQKAATPQR